MQVGNQPMGITPKPDRFVGGVTRMPRIRFTGLAAIFLLLTGCQTARMQVDPSLANVPPIPVERTSLRKWNDPVRFGQWHTTSVEEGWIQGKSLELRDASKEKEILTYSKLTQPYHFVMPTLSGAIDGQCFARAKTLSREGLEVDVAALRSIPPLRCTYTGAGEGALELQTRRTLKGGLAGEMLSGGDRWQVDSIFRIEGASFDSGDTVGYEIRRSSELIGAVEVINHGRVWISPALTQPEQDRVAAIATALLLYRPLERRDES
ncbi:MAG TPA: hypothetical protein VKB34_12480 [Povalibacter sp.]|nr:hypothetical protein [Povalibacter sp.]